MGTYCSITFDDYSAFNNKNWYFQEIVNLIFQPEDFIVEHRKNSSKNQMLWGDRYEGDEELYEFKGFKQKAKVCRERLEIYGNSPKKARKDFIQAKKIAKEEAFYSFPLSQVSYDKYKKEIKTIISQKSKHYDELFTNLKDSLIAGDLGIYGQSLECHLHSILSVIDDNAFVEYDLSGVIENGWLDEEVARTVDYEKIIVLTEGKTDVEFISQSIEKLYPHLTNYYHFIDFQEYKIESNASALVKLVTSFAAANVKHPILALFDNDTTGIMEMNKLNSHFLTDNIRVLKFPDTAIAENYPTVGPTGKKVMNINGLACGIEMYLGIDVLTKENNLIPIRWKNFNDKEKKYQGELAEKAYVQDEFRKKLKNSLNDEYFEMNCLLNEIFNGLK
ncbi:HEPN/Toprim-associated domain-containing protein [Arenibacter sp. F20364]|uniref:HEPN/Toprim-associated domain-containing protein n=1 Tax=Arenibacter sp. F20364 TaxID=2926415 RepID=UPI001FF19297|nr:HEPN/Toprim-associated domain-containing protein [Arenibacter sp. F20364]MCK0190847.1 HEPN/Toprim-associated domain-containing protein [Arenibacter sp. F20364]